MTNLPPSDRCRVRRKPERGHYDRPTIHAILDAAHYCHIAFSHDGLPQCLPMACWRVDDHLYIHGARQSRLVLALQAVAASVCVTHLDGLVFARAAFRHSMNYRSVVIHGHFATVDEPRDKARSMTAFLEHFSPGRSAAARPPSPAELAATTILRLPLHEAAAKIRAGGPADQGEDVSQALWTGVIPCRTQYLAAQPAADCGAVPRPSLPLGAGT